MTTQFAPNSMSLPPPRPTDLDLFDGAHPVGWVRGFAIGFRGFADENEAAGAAWVAHRTLARRLARRHGGGPAPIDVEPLSLAEDGERLVILAGGKPIATLLPPAVDSQSGPDSFGFEIEVPVPLDELSLQSLARRTYHTLRKSGARWAMLDTGRVARWRAVLGSRPDRQRRPATVTPAAVGERARSRDHDLSDESVRERGWVALGVVSMLVLGLAVVVPEELAVAFAAIGLAGLIVFRLTAAWVGWTPGRTTRVKSSAAAKSRNGTPPQLASS